MNNLCPKLANRNREQIWGIYERGITMKDRQRALYAYLLSRGDEWTSQSDIARSDELFRYYGNAECCLEPKEYHNTTERLVLLSDLQAIKTDPEFEKLVISSPKGVKIANEEEFDRYIKSQYKSAIRKLARVYKMAKKGNRNGQIDFGGHTVESFLEKCGDLI